MSRKSKIKSGIIDYVLILLGSVAYATAVNMFLAPNQIAPGGVTGISTIFNHLFNFPIGVSILVLNIPLFIWGVIEDGKGFIAKSLVATVAISVFIDISNPFIYKYTDDKLLAALYGGILSGVGLAIIFYRGGTTGGTSLIARNIHKRIPHISMGTVILITDALVIIGATFAYKSLESGLYAVVVIFISSKLIDSLIYGMAGDNGKLAFIITKEHKTITKEIIKTVVRGVTLIDAKGGYDDDDKKVILCAVRPSQVSKVNDIVKELDPNAFIVITTAGAIKGKGFEETDI